MPPIFADIPTDAEYALQIIGERVARGESVVPERKKRPWHARKFSQPLVSVSSLADAGVEKKVDSGSGDGNGMSMRVDTEVNWRKWTERAISTREWVEEGKRVLLPEKERRPGVRLPQLLFFGVGLI